MSNHLSFLLFCLLLAPDLQAQAKQRTPASAEQLELRVNPEALGILILDKKIKLMTHDGTYVEGRVLKASQDEITLRVKESRPRDRVTRPEAVIHTVDISVIHMKKPGPVAAPITLGILGGFGGAALGIAIAAKLDGSPAIILSPLATTIGGSVGGALLGREAARKPVTIYVNRKDPMVPGEKP